MVLAETLSAQCLHTQIANSDPPPRDRDQFGYIHVKFDINDVGPSSVSPICGRVSGASILKEFPFFLCEVVWLNWFKLSL